MSQESRAEPGRRPDVWLPPTESGWSTAPTQWRQPPGWREPTSNPAGDRRPEPPASGPVSGPTAPPRRAAQGPRRAARGSWPTSVPRTSARSRGIILVVVLGIMVSPFFTAPLLNLVLGTPSRGRTPPAAPPPPAPVVGTVWTVLPGQLRPDLPTPEMVDAPDGTFRPESFVSAVDGLWVVLTGTQDAESTTLHALDPATGTVRWSHPLDGALCATEAPKAGILCASVLARDPATGLGTRWRLHLLDPATGADRATRDIDGWLTAVHWTGRALVVLEQRQPAPHAALQGFGADLRPLWSLDLAAQPGQAELFSEDRIILRHEPDRPGLALDRPRLRDVGKNLVALWAGQRTAFVDSASGRLVMMPHCSRLVDDGTRLWCNEVDGASAYSYEGRPLVRVHGPRLAFPDDNGVGVDRNRPVFLNDEGAGVTVDPTTGAVGAAYTPPGRGSAFGLITEPSEATVGSRTFLIGEAGAMLLDPKQDRVAWREPQITISNLPVRLGDSVLLGYSELTRLDLTTGATVSTLRVRGTTVVALGNRIAGVGYDGVSLLDL